MIATVPNMLTALRIVAAPCLVVPFLVAERPAADIAAFALFAAAAATDFLDGWLARRLDQASAVGAMLDPVADKAMVTIALALLMALHGPAAWLAVPVALILAREVLVSGLREHLGQVSLAVTPLAKGKTAAQMVAIGVLLLAPALGGWALWAGAALLWLAAALTVLSGGDYMRKALAYIAEREA
jgi:CDP-diacylglycerol--glycerol-3-phosphate 3-phosphatidyltransferase